jgi:hypothetical protein
MKFPKSVIVSQTVIGDEEYFTVDTDVDDLIIDVGATKEIAIYRFVETKTVRRVTEVVE